MKKILPIIAITAALAFLIASCKSNPNANSQFQAADTSGFAQFQVWKAAEAQALLEKQQTRTIVKYVPVSQSSGSMSSSSSNEAKVVKKKGWSKAAKYGVIGGGGGAVLGTVINKKNRVAGGVIGGIVGGGLGYLFGRHQDKKDGRY